MKNKIKFSLLLAILFFCLPAIGFAQTQDSLQQDSIKKVQGPCPHGMIYVGAQIGQTVKDDSIGQPVVTSYNHFPALKWTECVSGKEHTRPARSGKNTNTDVYWFAFRTDTILCAIEREVIKKEKWVSVECEIEYRPAIKYDSAFAKYHFYPTLGGGASKFHWLIGTGFYGRQYFTHRKDEEEPWIQNFFQVRWGAEVAASIQREGNQIKPECTNCGNLGKKEDSGWDVGLDSKVFVYAEIGGKRTLRQDGEYPDYNTTFFMGAAYHFTELDEQTGKTINRKEDGLGIVAGATLRANNQRGETAKFRGPEIEGLVEYRPTVNEWHVGFTARGVFGDERGADCGPGMIERSANWIGRSTTRAATSTWNGLKSAAKWTGKTVKKIFSKRKKKEDEKPKSQPEIQSIWY